MISTKKQTINFINNLPDDINWDIINDFLYEIYVMKKIEKGLKDGEEARVVSHEEILKKYTAKI